jgi:tRNA(Ile)-lysidine synthase
LAAVAPLAGERGFVLRCFHVEHGIRSVAESRGDAEAVKDLAARFNIPWRVCHIPSGRIAGTARRWGSGIEAAARRFRRRAFIRELKRIGAARVLVAHTQDDLLENVLMGFLRGSGPAGLAAMPLSRGPILRPLITVSRARITAWLAERNIPYRTDSTNSDTALFRNRVRLLLVPPLDGSFPAWRNAALRLAGIQRRAADMLAHEAARRLPWEADGGAAGEFSLSVDRGRFFDAPLLVREEALFRGADSIAKRRRGDVEGPDVPGRLSRPGRFQTGAGKPRRDAILRFAAGDCAAMDLGPFRAEIRGERVTLLPPRRGGGERGFSLLITEPGRYPLKGLVFVVGAGAVGEAGTEGGRGPAFQAELPCALRSRLPADHTAFHALARSWFLEYTEIITACDGWGVAALIGIRSGTAEIAARREETPGKKGAGGRSVAVRIEPAQNLP